MHVQFRWLLSIVLWKLNNDINYLAFNTKKYKSDAEKALNDALAYQEIVKTLEEQLNQYKDVINSIKEQQMNIKPKNK